MNKAVQIQKERLSYQTVKKLLLELDPQFAKRLSETLVLEEYAKKLSDFAYFFSAKIGEEYVGICAFYINEIKQEYFLPYLCVSSSYRNMGVAGKIFETICQEADKIDFNVSLEVRNDNTGAIHLYHKFGFLNTSVGEEKTSMTRVYNK